MDGNASSAGSATSPSATTSAHPLPTLRSPGAAPATCGNGPPTASAICPQPYPDGAKPVQGRCDGPVIQTVLFDVLAATATLLVVLPVDRWVRQGRVGALAATFVAVYGTGRLAFDVFREDARYGGLTASQWIALVIVALAVAWPVASATAPTDPSNKPHDDPRLRQESRNWTRTPVLAPRVGRQDVTLLATEALRRTPGRTVRRRPPRPARRNPPPRPRRWPRR